MYLLLFFSEKKKKSSQILRPCHLISCSCCCNANASTRQNSTFNMQRVWYASFHPPAQHSTAQHSTGICTHSALAPSRRREEGERRIEGHHCFDGNHNQSINQSIKQTNNQFIGTPRLLLCCPRRQRRRKGRSGACPHSLRNGRAQTAS